MKSNKLSNERMNVFSLFGLMTSEQLFELIRYGMVGTLSFLTYVGMSNFLHWLGFLALLATLIAGIMSLAVSYFGHIHVTYKVQPEHTRMSWRFLMLTLLNLSLVQALTWVIHLHLNVSFGLTSIIVSLVSPLLSWPVGKFWVFATLKNVP